MIASLIEGCKLEKIMFCVTRNVTPDRFARTLRRARFEPPRQGADLRLRWSRIVPMAHFVDEHITVPACAVLFGGKYLKHCLDKGRAKQAALKRRALPKMLWFEEMDNFDLPQSLSGNPAGI